MHKLCTNYAQIMHKFTLLIIFLIPALLGYNQLQLHSVTPTESTCPNNGTITINATSPNPPLLYSIISGPVTQEEQTNPVFSSLPPGSYSIKVIDGIGNEVVETTTVEGNYQNPSFTALPTSPICIGENNGEIVVNIADGTGLAPYSYELLPTSPVTRTQDNNLFENLPSGNYSVRVTDSCGSVQTNAIT